MNEHGEADPFDTSGSSVIFTPKKVDLGSSVSSVALGGYHTCAILENDVLKCYGENTRGQLGLGYTNSTYVKVAPTAVDVGENRNATAISLGNRHSCAVLDNDDVKCWVSCHEDGITNLQQYLSLPSSANNTILIPPLSTIIKGI